MGIVLCGKFVVNRYLLPELWTRASFQLSLESLADYETAYTMSPLPGASICVVPLNQPLSSKELFLEQAFPRKYIVSLDSDKFSRTLSAIVVKGS